MAIHSPLYLLPSCLSPPPPKLFNFSPTNTTTPNTTVGLFSSTRFRPQTRPISFSTHLMNSNFSAAVVVGEDFPADYTDWLPKRNPYDRRRAGVLLHPTSFPGPYGIGDLGDQAFRFLDWLNHSGCSLWQVLPLVPPDEGGSPYSGQDANCGNTILISLEELVKDGLLMKEELPEPVDGDRVQFSTIADIKAPLIAKAAERLILSEGELKRQLEDFRKDLDIASPYCFLRGRYAYSCFLEDHQSECLTQGFKSGRNRYVTVVVVTAIRYGRFCSVIEIHRPGSISNGATMLIVCFMLRKIWCLMRIMGIHSKTSLSFCWLEDAAYFAAIDNSLNTFSWYNWPEPLKNRHLAAFEEIYQSKKGFIDIFIAQQFLFQRQWQKVRDYARIKGISIMGDMPIYVGYHSADVWANKKHFLLNRSGFPLLVSGVPPDAFSETGQLWGSPLYDWKAMEKYGFSWWICRIRRAQNLFDEFRIDHFRGFAGFWAVPSGEGVITEDVVQLRKAIGAPGMAVLQFGFGSDADNPHLPHNHEYNQVVYTGTHDNDTIRGWWDILPQEEKSNVLKYLSITEEEDISWALIQAALSSVARTAIIPMQDILCLGRLTWFGLTWPAVHIFFDHSQGLASNSGNWSWRIPSSTTFDSLETESRKLRDLLSMYGRL
ncbi:hypothetical protein TEA_030177 [Camellia sinensis var. sinensis]|uniref:4-alpha-glucanotransferase n=1 Tax=Camellia sinensis var. sinensis TaxID=542762 RepID=A0A4S4D937_CAMSN|nr:hypothetical protein TEA_030177 [Camellia sinensis var. sinensis]